MEYALSHCKTVATGRVPPWLESIGRLPQRICLKVKCSAPFDFILLGRQFGNDSKFNGCKIHSLIPYRLIGDSASKGQLVRISGVSSNPSNPKNMRHAPLSREASGPLPGTS